MKFENKEFRPTKIFRQGSKNSEDLTKLSINELSKPKPSRK